MNNENLSSISLKLLTLFFLFFLPLSSTVNAQEKEVDINTNPKGYFFDVGNLKPGDWMPRDITIMNDGTSDFKYTAIIGKKKSKKRLLEELELLVKKDSVVLYEGKLNEFEGFTPRNLDAGTSETIQFQVTMPTSLGNKFQDSSAEVEILFIAELLGTPDDAATPGGNEPPNNGTPNSELPGGSDPSENEGILEDGTDSMNVITITPEIKILFFQTLLLIYTLLYLLVFYY